MSPMAHSLSPARIRSSVSTVFASGSRPTLSSPTSRMLLLRPAATSSRSASTRRSPAVRTKVPSCSTRSTSTPVCTVMPSASKSRVMQLARLGLLDREQPVVGLDHGDVDPEAGDRLRQLAADRAAAEDDQAAGQLGDLHDVAVGPVRRVRQAVDRQHEGLGAGVEHDAPGRLVLARPRPRRRPGATSRPWPRTSRTPASWTALALASSVQPLVASSVMRRGRARPVGLDRRRAGEVVGPVDHGDVVGGPDHQLAGGAPVERALAAHQVHLHPDGVETGLGQLGGQLLPAGTEPEDDDVTGDALAHRSAPLSATGAGRGRSRTGRSRRCRSRSRSAAPGRTAAPGPSAAPGRGRRTSWRRG